MCCRDLIRSHIKNTTRMTNDPVNNGGISRAGEGARPLSWRTYDMCHTRNLRCSKTDDSSNLLPSMLCDGTEKLNLLSTSVLVQRHTHERHQLTPTSPYIRRPALNHLYRRKGKYSCGHHHHHHQSFSMGLFSCPHGLVRRLAGSSLPQHTKISQRYRGKRNAATEQKFTDQPLGTHSYLLPSSLLCARSVKKEGRPVSSSESVL